MKIADSAALLSSLLEAARIAPDLARKPVRVWARSGVERLHLAGGGSVVFKYAEEPFDREHLALNLAAGHGLPVPVLLAAQTAPGMLGMLLEDLGQPVRDADLEDAARAAVALHRVPVAGARWLPRLDQTTLAGLPAWIASRAAMLRLGDRVTCPASAIAGKARQLAQGAMLPPAGFCHSEFHPTSVHIGSRGWRLLDFARAFTGPGLLDLASWQGTITEPDPEAAAALIRVYIRVGGPAEAAAPRGGLPASDWALGWHRVWICAWYTEQIERGWAGNDITAWADAISRHLTEAAVLLRV